MGQSNFCLEYLRYYQELINEKRCWPSSQSTSILIEIQTVLHWSSKHKNPTPFPSEPSPYPFKRIYEKRPILLLVICAKTILYHLWTVLHWSCHKKNSTPSSPPYPFKRIYISEGLYLAFIKSVQKTQLYSISGTSCALFLSVYFSSNKSLSFYLS